MNHNNKIIIITGPTASGKTSLAVQLSMAIKGEIISADSRQVFRKMDIGTGKDLDEYGDIPYHLIDILDPSEEFSVAEFQRLTLKAINEIHSRRKFPIICGGTGHYIKALIENYQFRHASSDRYQAGTLERLSRQELYDLLEQNGLGKTRHWEKDSRRRMARAIEKARIGKKKSSDLLRLYHFPTRIYFTYIDRALLRKRIKVRLKERLERGMIEEVSNFISSGIDNKRLERFGLEYKWVLFYLKGDINYKTMEERLYVDICRFSKRQVTFLRYLEKSGHELIPVQSYTKLLNDVKQWLSAL